MFLSWSVPSGEIFVSPLHAARGHPLWSRLAGWLCICLCLTVCVLDFRTHVAMAAASESLHEPINMGFPSPLLIPDMYHFPGGPDSHLVMYWSHQSSFSTAEAMLCFHHNRHRFWVQICLPAHSVSVGTSGHRLTENAVLSIPGCPIKHFLHHWDTLYIKERAAIGSCHNIHWLAFHQGAGSSHIVPALRWHPVRLHAVMQIVLYTLSHWPTCVNLPLSQNMRPWETREIRTSYFHDFFNYFLPAKMGLFGNSRELQWWTSKLCQNHRQVSQTKEKNAFL